MGKEEVLSIVKVLMQVIEKLRKYRKEHLSKNRNESEAMWRRLRMVKKVDDERYTLLNIL